MRIIGLSLLILITVVFFIPGEKCTKKFQLTLLLALIAVFILTVFREVYYFNGDLKDLLLLEVSRIEGRLSMLAVYFTALCSLIIFLKSTFYRYRSKKVT